LIRDASVLFFTPRDQLFDQMPVLSGNVRLTILYGTAKTTTHEPMLTGLPFLSLGSFTLPVNDSSWRFCVSGGIFSQPLFGDIRGLFALVPAEGPYSIIADGAVRGFLLLGPSEGENTFQIPGTASGMSVSHAYFNYITPTSTASPTPTHFFTIWETQTWKRSSIFLATGWFLFSLF
jgi:hypothetical protein